MSRLSRLGLALAFVFIVLTASYAFVRVAERGRFATPYSTYGAGAEGARALLFLTQQLGYQAAPFTRELGQLPRGTLVALSGCRAERLRKVSRPEREALARWVEAGGLLISIGVPDLLPPSAGLFFQGDAACDDPPPESLLEGWLASAGDDQTRAVRGTLEVVAETRGPPLSYLLPFNVREPRTLRLGHDAEASEILSSELGTLGLTAPYGLGRVVLLGIPEALTNAALSDGGGLVFARLLRAFAPAGPVMFDEYHLGMGERRSLIGYVRDLGYAPLLLQLFLAVLATLLALSARVAPAVPRPAARVRVGPSFFAALSALLYDTRDGRAALHVLADAARLRIAHGYHARGVPPSRLEPWLTARGLFAAAHYARAIARHAREPLGAGESVLSRAQAIDQDATLAVAIATLEPGSRR